MNYVDGISDVVSLLFGFVLGRAQKGNNASAWSSGLLSGKKLSLSTHTDARHFSFSLCVTGALPVAAPVLELGGSESA